MHTVYAYIICILVVSFCRREQWLTIEYRDHSLNHSTTDYAYAYVFEYYAYSAWVHVLFENREYLSLEHLNTYSNMHTSIVQCASCDFARPLRINERVLWLPETKLWKLSHFEFRVTSYKYSNKYVYACSNILQFVVICIFQYELRCFVV